MALNEMEIAAERSGAQMRALMQSEDPAVQARLEQHARAIMENQLQILRGLGEKIAPMIRIKRHNKLVEVWETAGVNTGNRVEESYVDQAIMLKAAEKIESGDVKTIRIKGIHPEQKDVIFSAYKSEKGSELVQVIAEPDEKIKPRELEKFIRSIRSNGATE